uniref:Pco139890 n=1 Tax=Arundo donax TaxID=35708 RepID=A0A0A9EF64_ARUDO
MVMLRTSFNFFRQETFHLSAKRKHLTVT